jgi:glutaredoxin 3
MTQANVIIYLTTYCPYCEMAKKLLDRKGVTYTTIDVTGNDALRLELVDKTGGRRTVPQIFINDVSIGGYDDLAALDKAGKLDELLNPSSRP